MITARKSSLVIGTPISRYTVESFLGAGGMGEVYAARDEALGRRVALKILSVARAGDPSRIERFVREAHAASSLNHPSIVTIFDSGQSTLPNGASVQFVAMELVEGETLTQWAHSRRSLERIAGVMGQVADGLARAHARGIVHRDLKPDNIMVARGGYPKILDFGVAKLLGPSAAEDSPDSTQSSDTAPSELLGTAAYMSPEQVAGTAIDHRSDIFSFGVVLLELVTGRSPFQRPTTVETLHAVMRDDPAIAVEARDPAALLLERVIRRCLVKDPEERFQSIKDVALDLREVARSSDARRPSARDVRRWPEWPVVATGAGVLLVALVGLRLSNFDGRTPRNPVEATAFAQPMPPQTHMIRMTSSGRATPGAISPDGRYLVHAALDGENQTVWVKQIATDTNVRILPPSPTYYTDFKISPDGNYVYYAASRRDEPNITNLFQVSILGGEPRRISNDIDGTFTLSPDGHSVAFRRFSALVRDFVINVADIDSGSERVVLKRRHPSFIGEALSWSPDGRRIAFITGTIPGHSVTLCELDLGTRQIDRIPSPVWPGIGSLAWLSDGSGLLVTAFEQQQPPQIWFVPRHEGKARKITADLSSYSSITVTADSKSFAASRSEGSANIWTVRLDLPQRARPLTTGLGNHYGGGGVRFMPDGNILFTANTSGPPALDAIGPDGGELRRHLTQGNAFWDPVISPDGSRIAFLSDKLEHVDIWTSDLDGSNLRQVTTVHAVQCPTWFPDGKSIAYLTVGNEQTAWRIDVQGGQPRRLIEGPANFLNISPDGRWLLCRLRSRESGMPLWRTALVPIGSEGKQRFFEVPLFGPQIFNWMPDGRSFLYVDSVGGIPNLWQQAVGGGEPHQLTRFDSGVILSYDVARDGKSVALSRGELASDLVLIRDFR
jgi:serine/threonine protein kinase